jgi:hypothetical protein
VTVGKAVLQWHFLFLTQHDSECDTHTQSVNNNGTTRFAPPRPVQQPCVAEPTRLRVYQPHPQEHLPAIVERRVNAYLSSGFRR